MLNTLSKTVAIASIMCSVLFAQNSTDKISVKDSVSKDSIQNQIKDSIQAQTNLAPATSVLDTKDTTQKKDSTKQETAKEAPPIAVTERQATKEVPVVAAKDTVSKTQTTEKSNDPKKKLRTNKTLQTYNLNFPFESETWKVNSNKYDWNSLGITLSWTRYKTDESGFSTLFGLAAGYINGDLKDDPLKEKIKFNGLNLNMKLGLGYAPISNDLIIAIHFIGEVHAKTAYGSVSIDGKKVNPFAIYADATIGGTFMAGYQIWGSFGFLAGIDITTNAFGIGGYSQELTKASKVKQLNYVFTGVNITPHGGFFFAF